MSNRLRLACLHATCGDGTVQSRIVDTASGKEVFRLPGQFAYPGRAVWNGRYMLALYGTGKLMILDFVHMALRRDQ
jgi:hypothetical protein